MPGAAPVTIIHRGFDGKLPSRGDFIGRGLPKSFLTPWQAWVDASLTASRRTLGETWLPAWMEAPIWRFTLPADACGPDAVLGLTLPSVDRAGRHYPLTVAAVFAGIRTPPADTAWLDAVETLALDALALDHPPEALMDSLNAVPEPTGAPGEPAWWTTGSPRVPQTHKSTSALPAPETFAGMLDAGHPS
jgi:type VI secretion system protein ImpM